MNKYLLALSAFFLIQNGLIAGAFFVPAPTPEQQPCPIPNVAADEDQEEDDSEEPNQTQQKSTKAKKPINLGNCEDSPRKREGDKCYTEGNYCTFDTRSARGCLWGKESKRCTCTKNKYGELTLICNLKDYVLD